ncbi:hypothetical protein CHS0354_040959 [Potamilus streckersoni]|uniref:Uncharacterized protein n=1 Tax=Potamilus streckersoni TaxID=2493646 RepID=A0AAE0W8U5_9BIVA|nr:hypothetical protein CHS0354_040959 [Potamilus streckersoni]
MYFSQRKKKGCSLTEKELQDAMESKLALAFRPDCYYIMDELPRIGSRNKIWDAKLRQMAEVTWRTKIVTI